MSYYNTKRRGHKRQHKLLYMNYLEITIYNAFVTFYELMKEHLQGRKYTYLDFKKNLFKQTYMRYRPDTAPSTLQRARSYVERAPRSIPDMTKEEMDTIRFDTNLRHRPLKGEKTIVNGKIKHKNGDCAQCSGTYICRFHGDQCPEDCNGNSDRLKVFTKCQDCNVFLHIEDYGSSCYSKWHDQNEARPIVSLIF